MPAPADLLTVVPVPGQGAEDVLVDDEGAVYTGTEDGSVFRVRPDGNHIERVGNTGGRPLGLELLPDGRILVCDARRGLLALDPDDGAVVVLTNLVQGQRMVFCMVEGLAFANGVALASDESFVAVAETAGRSVVRRWLTGPREGETDDLVTDLPGYPDNIARGSDGLIWVTIASPKDPIVERLMRAPMTVRRAAWRLPETLQPRPRRTARVMAFDNGGSVVHDRALDASRFHMVTGVREHDGSVWLGSLAEPAVAVFEL
jgi:sugar lactone lactonase YvrE